MSTTYISPDDELASSNYSQLTIPNHFSPDMDGNYDTWYVIIGDSVNVQSFHIDISNRCKVLFSSDNIEIAWDGTYEGQTLKEGCYEYEMEVTMNNPAASRRGIRRAQAA